MDERCLSSRAELTQQLTAIISDNKFDISLHNHVCTSDRHLSAHWLCQSDLCQLQMQNCVQLLLQTASIFIHTRSSFSLVVGCDAAGKITGIIFGVVGPTFAAILWLSITFSYRQEKAKVIRGVMRHVATADITSNSSAFIGTAHNEAQKQKAKESLRMPLDTDSEPQAGLHPAGPDSITGQSTTRPVFGRSPNIDRAASLGSSIGRSSSIGLLGQLHRTASADSKTTAEVHQSRCLCSCCKCVRRLLCIGSDLC